MENPETKRARLEKRFKRATTAAEKERAKAALDAFDKANKAKKDK